MLYAPYIWFKVDQLSNYMHTLSHYHGRDCSKMVDMSLYFYS